MSYTTLYRKLRPSQFKDVIGQKFIIKTLINQIVNDRISHSYLFCGTRGTGKTSVAKILAKSINCLNNYNGEPCNKCSVCESIIKNRNLNTIEIDAASNNGVDNIREIIEEIKYPPTGCKYKVYIIDEVHMLSIGAFNALLKTLEEPPTHIVFILATTDPQKIPPTILSRCQRFDFKRISTLDMLEALKEYTLKEKIDIDEKALKYITKLSDGALRDALSMLDMTISYYYNNRITYENVLELVGHVDDRVLFELINSINMYDSKKTITIINDVIQKGNDITNFVTQIISHLRNLLVSLSIKDEDTSIDIVYENIEDLQKVAENIGYDKLLLYINIFNELSTKIKYANNKRVLLEATCIKLNKLEVENNIDNINIRLNKLENNLNENIPQKKEKQKEEVLKEEVQKEEIINKYIPKDINNIKKEWLKLINTFESPTIKESLKQSKIGYIKKDGKNIVIIIYDEQIPFLLTDKNKINLIENKIRDTFKGDFILKIVTQKEYDEEHVKVYGIKESNNDEKNYKNFTYKIKMNIIEEK